MLKGYFFSSLSNKNKHYLENKGDQHQGRISWGGYRWVSSCQIHIKTKILRWEWEEMSDPRSAGEGRDRWEPPVRAGRERGLRPGMMRAVRKMGADCNLLVPELFLDIRCRSLSDLISPRAQLGTRRGGKWVRVPRGAVRRAKKQTSAGGKQSIWQVWSSLRSYCFGRHRNICWES